MSQPTGIYQFLHQGRKTAQQEPDASRAQDASREVCRLIRNELGADLDPMAFRLFLRLYWHKLSTLCHEIHENEGTQ